MSERKESKVKFVGLHGHSTFSVFDGLGYPSEHMDFAYSNGSDALALTDHGNMSGLSYQYFHAKKMNSEGRTFKPIYGVEAYFTPSISDWVELRDKVREEKKTKSKKDTKEEDVSSLTLEDEGESKKKTTNPLNKRSHLVVLAKNQKGLSNLFKLVSNSYVGDSYYRFPRIDYEALDKHREGLIVSSACLGGVLASDMWANREEGETAVMRAMENTHARMYEIFGDDWYGELQWNAIPEQHDLNGYIIQLAKRTGLRLISTADSHYPTPESWSSRIIYKNLGWRSNHGPATPPTSVAEVGYELYPKNGDQMWQSYKDYSQFANREYDDSLVMDSIELTHDIAHNSIEKVSPDTSVKLPSFLVPPGQTPDEALRSAASEGLVEVLSKRRGPKPAAYSERLERELGVISDLNFSQYFLTMKAISDEANQRQITGAGRGSGAGSLVAYALGITQVDPIKYDLQFERFLRSDSEDYPDIDFDVSAPMELKEHLIEKWGRRNVVPISNWNTLQLKSLVKDIAKLYDIPFQEVNEVTKKMLAEATPLAKEKNGIASGVYTATYEEVLEFSTTLQKFLMKYPEVNEHINSLQGMVRSCSRHAGGLLISEDLDKHMPLIGSNGVLQSPWTEGQTVRHLEPLGFIKFDILGLNTLAMIEGTIERIIRNSGVKKPTFKDTKEFYNKYLHPDNADLEDQNVYENVFHAGRWPGIFQFTEQPAQQFCSRAKPRNIIDIATITSIFRPGPLAANVDKQYIDAKDNPEKIRYVHPIMKKVLEPTYGFCVFQEQIAQIAHLMGKDISLNDGNVLRKVLTKKGTGKADKVIAEIHPRFIEGCLEKGLSDKQAQSIWDTLEYFSSYGFNSAHAVSYSIISYQCAWLFTYYPSEWLASFLDHQPDAKREKSISIVKSLGYEIVEADINNSSIRWEAVGKKMYQPLSSIKNVGDAALKEIFSYRPFNTIEEFLFHPRMTYSKVNKKNIDALVRAGCLRELQDERFTGDKHFWSSVAVIRPRKEKNLLENIELYKDEGSFTLEEKINSMIDLTGIYPLKSVVTDKMLNDLHKNKIPPISDYIEGKDRVCWFVIKQLIQKTTAKGKLYLLLKAVDDTGGENDIRCWNYDRFRDNIKTHSVCIGKLTYSEQWGFAVRDISKDIKVVG